MHWLADYWWVVLILLAGIVINAIKELNRINTKRFLDNKSDLPPHRDRNAEWDDEDDWPRKNHQKMEQDQKK
ncbi:MAG: YpfN family protein [Enterobacteriaceae bacterium]|nr:YpfN family protein [Enterobacteriaceae bacterium]